MRIGLDVLGGDFAPEATVLGAIAASKEVSATTKIVLIGDAEKINSICQKENFDPSVFEIIHTTEFIGMGEHPAKAFQQKSNSSISLGFELLRKNEIDSFASAGSTGAMMVGAMYSVKPISGVQRPVITANVPNDSNTPTLLLDVGLNPDTKPDVLVQYGMLGSLYCQHMYQIEKPRVALLNIGEEEEKGNLITKAAYQLMKETQSIHFVGNFEANEFFSHEKADVVVCDGFVGNVVLKEAEAFYLLLRRKGIKSDYFEKFNFENYGGTPVLGVNKPVIIGHGISNAKAIKNMILHSCQVVESKLIDKIKEAFE